MKPVRGILALALCLVAVSGMAPAMADPGITATEAVIVRPMAQDSPAAAYVVLTNGGRNADALMSASSPLAGSVYLHQMMMHGGMMMMQDVTTGVALPAGKAVSLSDGGIHLMVEGLKAPLAPGKTFPIDLHFAHAPAMHVDFTVVLRPPGATSHNAHK